MSLTQGEKRWPASWLRGSDLSQLVPEEPYQSSLLQWEDLSLGGSSDDSLTAWPGRILQQRAGTGRMEQMQPSSGAGLSQDGAAWEGTTKENRMNGKLAAATKLLRTCTPSW